jgi:Raf kinase inhibitor-like YbhB/YbcL family protein
MKKIFILLAIFVLSGCATPVTNSKPLTVTKTYESASSSPLAVNKIYMKLTSSNFNNGDFLPVDFSCQGKGRAPLLQIADAPKNTAAYALIVDDPDAPTGVFTHWLVWNISATTTTINAGELPRAAIAGANSAGSIKYFPPCPPSGIHHYYYRLYALDNQIDLPAKSKAKQLLGTMAGHIIDEAVLMGKLEGKK